GYVVTQLGRQAIDPKGSVPQNRLDRLKLDRLGSGEDVLNLISTSTAIDRVGHVVLGRPIVGRLHNRNFRRWVQLSQFRQDQLLILQTVRIVVAPDYDALACQDRPVGLIGGQSATWGGRRRDPDVR